MKRTPKNITITLVEVNDENETNLNLISTIHIIYFDSILRISDV